MPDPYIASSIAGWARCPSCGRRARKVEDIGHAKGCRTRDGLAQRAERKVTPRLLEALELARAAGAVEGARAVVADGRKMSIEEVFVKAGAGPVGADDVMVRVAERAGGHRYTLRLSKWNQMRPRYEA